MIGIVDTGGANHTSIRNALLRLGHSSELSFDKDFLKTCSHLILPGVGHAGFAMERLKRYGLVDFIREQTKPILGICLGMQLLFDASEEGDVECLKILPGKVTKIEPAPGIRVPHMGWSQLQLRMPNSPLLRGVVSGSYFYFVHSFRVPDGAWIIGDTSANPQKLPAALEAQNFFGTQFHPERSADLGAQVLKNFIEKIPAREEL